MSPLPTSPETRSSAPLWLTILLTAAAGGMAWGIRGQYGHETGAMMAGVLIGFSLILTCTPHLSSLQAARAVALLTVGISFGGQQTYGQVLGLTQDRELIGNWDSLRWGLLGTFVLGANWAGFGGLLFGIGLGGKRYGAWEMGAIACGMIGLIFLGHAALNLPFDPSTHRLPLVYFSDNWSWNIRPNAAWKPRPEIWGGLLFAWIGLMLYVSLYKRDKLARNMGLFGFIAGIGFPIGQSIQAGNAWNPALFKSLTGWTYGFVNWWNMMEITFGTVIGIVLAVGLYLNKGLLQREDAPENAPRVSIPRGVELVLILVHLWLLVGSEFLLGELLWGFPLYPLVAAITAGMGIIPLVGIVGGRWWPYLFPTAMVAVTISGKTWLAFQNAYPDFPLNRGLFLIVALPLTLSIFVGFYFSSRRDRDADASRYSAFGLLWSSWLFFTLNTIIFEFPLDWTIWGGRTHSQIIYTIQVLLISLITISLWSRSAARASST